jgi:isochorismate pyruvate lyase
MKTPQECGSLQDVRAEIDRLDHAIISLLAERSGYVKVAARFKSDVSAVAAIERLRTMLEDRRRWAAQSGLSPEFVDDLCQRITEYFIGEEGKHQHLKDR